MIRFSTSQGSAPSGRARANKPRLDNCAACFRRFRYPNGHIGFAVCVSGTAKRAGCQPSVTWPSKSSGQMSGTELVILYATQRKISSNATASLHRSSAGKGKRETRKWREENEKPNKQKTYDALPGRNILKQTKKRER